MEIELNALIVENDISMELASLCSIHSKTQWYKRFAKAIRLQLGDRPEADLANALDIRVDFLTKLESGSSCLSIPNLVVVCKELKTGLPWMLAKGPEVKEPILDELAKIKPKYKERDWCYRLGTILQLVRIRNHKSQKDLSDLVGIGISSIDEQEEGDKCLEPEVLLDVCKAFSITLPWLFYEASQAMSYNSKAEMMLDLEKMAQAHGVDSGKDV